MGRLFTCNLGWLTLPGFLFFSRLVMSYLAVEMAKEMRGNPDGVMETSDGHVVKVQLRVAQLVHGMGQGSSF